MISITVLLKIHSSQIAASLEAGAYVRKLLTKVREEIRLTDTSSSLKTVYLHALQVFCPWRLQMSESTNQSEPLLGTMLEIVLGNLSDFTWLHLCFMQMKQGCNRVPLYI